MGADIDAGRVTDHLRHQVLHKRLVAPRFLRLAARHLRDPRCVLRLLQRGMGGRRRRHGPVYRQQHRTYRTSDPPKRSELHDEELQRRQHHSLCQPVILACAVPERLGL